MKKNKVSVAGGKATVRLAGKQGRPSMSERGKKGAAARWGKKKKQGA
jgi:hypothetical protein